MSRNSIGPALPPGFGQRETTEDSDEDIIGPALPQNIQSQDGITLDDDTNVIGPALPEHLKTTNEKYSSDDDSGDIIGPILPKQPSKSAMSGSKSTGPSLPSTKGDNSDNDIDQGFMGPALPPGFITRPSVIGPALPPGVVKNRGDNSEPEDDDPWNIVGPLPSEMDRSGNRSNVAEEFEKRAQTMKDKLTQPEDVPLVRESWMTELPPEMGANFGLTARKFRSNPSNKGEDRSVWTDTPSDKAKKEKEGASSKGKSELPKDPILSVRDRKIAQEVEQYNKNKRKESLLDMHQTERKKIKNETKDEEEPAGRRPFDRDTDLQVNRFDDAQRKSVIKKSQKLNTRFSHGSNSQFL